MSDEITKYERQNIIYLVSHDYSVVGGRVGGGLVGWGGGGAIYIVFSGGLSENE